MTIHATGNHGTHAHHVGHTLAKQTARAPHTAGMSLRSATCLKLVERTSAKTSERLQVLVTALKEWQKQALRRY